MADVNISIFLKDDNEKKDVTFYAFKSNVKHFLSSLLRDPINTKISDVLKDVGFSKQKLINILLKRDVIRRHESIDDKDKENGNVNYVVKYNIVRKNFERKIKRIYNKYVEGGKKIGDGNVEECTTCGASSGAYVAPLFSKPVKKTAVDESTNVSKNIFITEEQYEFLRETLTTANAGNYQYNVPFPVKKGDPSMIHRKKGGISMERKK